MTSASPHLNPSQNEPLPRLRARRGEQGPLYKRRPEIETAIHAALFLPRDTMLARALILRRDAPGYIPSEVLVHCLRRTKTENSTQFFDRLYDILIQRIEALCRSRRQSAGSESIARERIRESVVDDFIFRVAKDREDYYAPLDYLEISFDQHIARRRLDARKSVGRRESRTDAIAPPTADGYTDPAIEQALSDTQGHGLSEKDRLDARIDLAAAIAQLPEKERTVIILDMQDIQIESKNPEIESISSLLDCHPKTVRNRLSRGKALLREILESGDRS